MVRRRVRHSSFFKLFHVFDGLVWLALLSALALTTAALFAVVKLSPYCRENRATEARMEERHRGQATGKYAK